MCTAPFYRLLEILLLLTKEGDADALSDPFRQRGRRNREVVDVHAQRFLHTHFEEIKSFYVGHAAEVLEPLELVDVIDEIHAPLVSRSELMLGVLGFVGDAVVVHKALGEVAP